MRDLLYIGGEWKPASDQATFAVIDPSDESVLANVASATVDDVNQAIDKLTIHDVFLEKNTPVGDSGPSNFANTDSFRLKLGSRTILRGDDAFQHFEVESTKEPMTKAQREDLKLLKELDEAHSENDLARVTSVLEKFLKDDRVKIGNRKPVNQSVTIYASRLLEDLHRLVGRENDPEN